MKPVPDQTNCWRAESLYNWLENSCAKYIQGDCIYQSFCGWRIYSEIVISLFSENYQVSGKMCCGTICKVCSCLVFLAVLIGLLFGFGVFKRAFHHAEHCLHDCSGKYEVALAPNGRPFLGHPWFIDSLRAQRFALNFSLQCSMLTCIYICNKVRKTHQPRHPHDGNKEIWFAVHRVCWWPDASSAPQAMWVLLYYSF